MPHQFAATISALAAPVTGSHPGPAFYAEWIIVCGLVIGLPIYGVRLMRKRRDRG